MSAPDSIEALEFTSGQRSGSGVGALARRALLLLIPILGVLFIANVHVSLRLYLFDEQWIGLFAGVMLALAFLSYPATASARPQIPWYDWVLAALALSTGVYIALFYPSISMMLGFVTTDRVVMGTLSIVLTLEALRRTTGWPLVILVLVILSYGLLAPYMPGLLRGAPTPLPDYINYLYLDGNNGLGQLRIAATVALAFLLFGQVLSTFGGSEAINNLVFAFLGHRRGGPAKAAVVASGLVGTMSGGAAINVMITGVMSIPMMIRSGYSRAMAGAIEAVASTGGAIMPPVMGVAAFMIAENLAVPYSEVALAAVLPALLYYFCIFVQVDLSAARAGLKGMDRKELPDRGKALRGGWVIILLVGMLFYLLGVEGYDPSLAGLLTALVGGVALALRQAQWKSIPRKILQILEETSENMITITVVLAAAGLILGVTNITGLGFNVALALGQLCESGTFILLVVSALVCLVLGMGMPVVAAYALVAILVAPALEGLGLNPLAAHLFIFYFATISAFTPPVALACFAAASISGADPYQIGFRSMRLGIVALIVPFLFVYSPTLIMVGSTTSIAITAVTAFAGIYVLSTGLEGYWTQTMSTPLRIVAVAAGLMLIFPIHDDSVGLGYAINFAGGLLAAAVLLLVRLKSQKNTTEIAERT